MRISIKKSNLSRVALLATLITVTNGYPNAVENEATMKHYGAFFYAVERNLTDFFNENNKTPFVTYLTALEKLLNDFKRKIEETVTRSNTDGLTKEINDLIDYTTHKFSIAYNIMKKYCGRPASDALTFGVEIKRDFNAEKVFGDIVTKLKALEGKALQAHEDTLAKKIETVITMIERKRKEWNAKSDGILLKGLSCRMKCK